MPDPKSHSASVSPLSEVLAEIAALAGRVSEAEMERAAETVLSAGRVFVAGAGRSGLAARAGAMRLVHLGRTAFVVGETVTPAVGTGDLLLAVSRSGATPSILAVAARARSAGARLLAVTAEPASELAAGADERLILPAVPSVQFGGSLFEQAALIVLDTLALRLQRRLGVSEAEMQSRHANLE
jgi:6-phospho-3-hexuloisomerase